MSILVESEVGPLRRVLIHRPDDEIVRMTQHDLGGMLFDDILAPNETQREHDLMGEIMAAAGAEVVMLGQLLESALAAASQAQRDLLLRQVCEHAGVISIADELTQWPASRLGQGLIAGIYWDELGPQSASLARLRDELPGSRAFAIPPIPNAMFVRDPCISVFDQVLVGRMATAARAREPLLVAFALGCSPLLGPAPRLTSTTSLAGPDVHSLEGGDVLVLSPKIVMLGCSERSSPQAIEQVAQQVLLPAHPQLESVYVVLMPKLRSVMHLDTILTQIDRKLFLGHAPLVAGRRGQAPLRVIRLTRNRPATLVADASILDVLREELGPDVGFVPCGGHDPLFQEREQWTDGANAVALAPGKILLYARNTRTIAALVEQGFTEVPLSVVLPQQQRKELVAGGMEQARVIFSFSGSELSRARGGGRCLTMPLLRDKVTP